MTELNVLSRTQRIVVDPLTSSVAVMYAGATGPPGPASHTVGTPVISGLAYRGASPGTLVTYGSGVGTPIYLDDSGFGLNGQIQKVGTDIELISNGAFTWQFRVLATGLYHINGYVRVDGVAPPNTAQLGIRVNDICIRRVTLVVTGYSSVNISCDAYLNPGDRVGMFGYTGGANWMASYCDATAIDGISPRLDMWRISGVA